MITLGITGRSGCGKSTVTAVFAAHGVPLVDADQISREILLPGSPLLPVLARRFGEDILYADGSLNRRLLADRAFAAPEGKAALDSLVLPEIIRRVCRLKQAAREAGAPLFVIDGAVIVGTDAEKECDHLCVVTAPFATSVARIAARDGTPELQEQAAQMIADHELNVRQAEVLCKKLARPAKGPAEPAPIDTLPVEVEESLKEVLGSEVNVAYHGGKGRLTVHFYSDEQLRAFANLLGQYQQSCD